MPLPATTISVSQIEDLFGFGTNVSKRLSNDLGPCIGKTAGSTVSMSQFQSKTASWPSGALPDPGAPAFGVTQTVALSGQNYGNGNYDVLAATNVYGDPCSAFDKNAATRWMSQSFTYNQSSPYQYTGSQSTVAGGVTYTGEWIQIKLPYSIALYQYTVIFETTTTAPNIFQMFGSTNGSTWVLLDSRTGQTFTGAGPTNPVTYTVSSSTKYAYFRFTQKQLNGPTAQYGCKLMELTLIN